MGDLSALTGLPLMPFSYLRFEFLNIHWFDFLTASRSSAEGTGNMGSYYRGTKNIRIWEPMKEKLIQCNGVNQNRGIQNRGNQKIGTRIIEES